MTKTIVYMHLCPSNKKAMQALHRIVRFVVENCHDSWNPEDKKTLRAARYAVKHLAFTHCHTDKPASQGRNLGPGA